MSGRPCALPMARASWMIDRAPEKVSDQLLEAIFGIGAFFEGK